jgi:hypothetical protein
MVDVMDIGGGDVKAAWPPVNMTEFEAGLPNGGSVDNGKHFLQVIQKEPEKESFHPILKSEKVDILIQVLGFALEMAVAPPRLNFQCRYRFREKAEKLEFLPFFLGKGGSFIVDGVFHQSPSLERDFDIFLPCEWVTLKYVLHAVFS